MLDATLSPPETIFGCPACRGALEQSTDGLECSACARTFPRVAGMYDLRLESDRYLSLEAERAKAERLHAIEPGTNVTGLSEAYYAITEDVLDARRGRFLRHIAQAEVRGEALAERLPSAGRVLDVGCGTGGLLVAAARRGLSVEGADIAARWLVVARRRLSDRGLSVPLVAASVERLPWPDGYFDAVVGDSLLEHLDEPRKALGECLRVLRPGGTLLFWSPNRFTLTTDPHVGLWGLGWIPRAWVPVYLKLRGREVWPPRTLSPTEARRFAVAAGFARVEVDAPSISDSWAEAFSSVQRVAARGYAAARGVGATRALLRWFGPLWELRAMKKEAA